MECLFEGWEWGQNLFSYTGLKFLGKGRRNVGEEANTGKYFVVSTPRTKETLHIDRDGGKRIKGTRTSEYVPTKSHNISRNNENYSHEQLYPVTDLLQKMRK